MGLALAASQTACTKDKTTDSESPAAPTGGSPTDGSQGDGSEASVGGSNVDGSPVASSTADARAAASWPPENLHRFVGFGRSVRVLAVDDEYLYWLLSDGLYQAIKEADAEARLALACASCQTGQIAVHDDWIYLLDGDEVVKLQRDSLEVERIGTPWDHAMRGALLVDEGTIYTAAPGCVAISRTTEDGAQEETRFEAASPPSTSGATVLVKDGNRLVCGSPTTIYVLDTWQGQPRILRSEVNTLRGLAVRSGTTFWLEEDTISWARLGAVPTEGGEASLIYPKRDAPETAGHFGGLWFISAAERIGYATTTGVLGLNPSSKRLDAFLEVGSASGYMAADATHVYAAVAGRRLRTANTVAAPAAWIERAKVDDFASLELDMPAPAAEQPEPTDCPTQGETVLVPKGSFPMGLGGSTREVPTEVTLESSFQMDRTEVTVRQYAACVSAGACEAVTGGSCNLGRDGLDCHPVNCVNQVQAKAYCEWAGKQLPSAEEWEYAARGEEGRVFPWGAGEPADELLCWSGTARPSGTCAVGSRSVGATELGLLDMSGNVREWVDGKHCSTYPGGACTGPGCVERIASGCSNSGAPTYGGGWLSNERREVMAASREFGFIDRDASIYPDLGFRCVQRVTP